MASRRISLELGPENGQLKVKDGQALLQWLDEERSWWSALESKMKRHANAQALAQHTSQRWQSVETVASRFKASLASDPEADPKRLTQAVETAFQNRQLIRSKTPRAKFIESLLELDVGKAAAAASVLVGIGVPRSDPIAIEGAIRAVQFDVGTADTVASERASLEELREEWQGRLADIADAITAQQTEADAALAERRAAVREIEDDFKVFYEDARAQQGSITKAFMEHMTLEAPAAYWDKKADLHKGRIWPLAGLLILSFALVLALISGATWFMLFRVDDREFWGLAVIGLAAGLGIWVLRAPQTIFLSNLHQASDAAEKTIMVQTFLALLKDGHVEREADRQLVLSAMFRSASTGLIRDDGATPTIVDVTTKLLGDKRS